MSEVACPGCTECGMFTIITEGDAAWVKCMGCGHLIEVKLIGRWAEL